jgi:hypothetical protein
MCRHAEMQDPSAVMSQHQEYVQYLKANGRHRKEVSRYQTPDVILKEGPPRLRRRLAAAQLVFANAGFADVDAEFSGVLHGYAALPKEGCRGSSGESVFEFPGRPAVVPAGRDAPSGSRTVETARAIPHCCQNGH